MAAATTLDRLLGGHTGDVNPHQYHAVNIYILYLKHYYQILIVDLGRYFRNKFVSFIVS